MVVQKDPIEFLSLWHGSLISTSEGVSRSDDQMHPFQIDGARWHFLKTLTGSLLSSELLPFVDGEAHLQKNIDATDSFYTSAWTVLRAAQNLCGAKLFLGGAAVTAPPFFEIAGKLNFLYWHPDSTRLTCEIGDDPLVMALADFTDREFDEVYAPPLRIRQDWVILTPPVFKDSKKRLFLERHGRWISTGQGKILREKGWWMSGQDNLASYSTKLEGWGVHRADSGCDTPFDVHGGLAMHCLYPLFLEDLTLARLYRDGSHGANDEDLHSASSPAYDQVQRCSH